MSLATRSAASSDRPRFGSVMSPSTTTTFSRRNAASPSGAAVLVAQRIERRRGDHALPEARLAVRPRAAPDHDVGAPDLRIAVEQHAEQHLADEPGAAEDEEVAAAEDLGDRQRGAEVARRRTSEAPFAPGF